MAAGLACGFAGAAGAACLAGGVPGFSCAMIEGCAKAAPGKAMIAAKVMALAAEKRLVEVIACSRLRVIVLAKD